MRLSHRDICMGAGVGRERLNRNLTLKPIFVSFRNMPYLAIKSQNSQQSSKSKALPVCTLMTVINDFKIRVVANDMFSDHDEGNSSLRSIRNLWVRFPFHVTFHTVHLTLAFPPDSLHRSGGVCSGVGTQSRWVTDTPLGTFHLLYAYILTLRNTHPSCWGDIPAVREL